MLSFSNFIMEDRILRFRKRKTETLSFKLWSSESKIIRRSSHPRLDQPEETIKFFILRLFLNLYRADGDLRPNLRCEEWTWRCILRSPGAEERTNHFIFEEPLSSVFTPEDRKTKNLSFFNLWSSAPKNEEPPTFDLRLRRRFASLTLGSVCCYSRCLEICYVSPA